MILFDPIFEGLAVALITGSLASTLLTLVVVPGIYFLLRREKPQNEGSEATIEAGRPAEAGASGVSDRRVVVRPRASDSSTKGNET